MTYIHMPATKGSKSKTMKNKEDYTTKSTSKYYVRNWHETTPYKQIKPSTRVSIKSWKQGRVLNLDNDDNDHLITGGDEDGGGEIDLDEFTQLMSGKFSTKPSKASKKMKQKPAGVRRRPPPPPPRKEVTHVVPTQVCSP